MQALTDNTLLRHQLYIDGQWCDAQERRTYAVINPADGAELVQVADGAAADARRAIDAAAAALPGWRNLSAKERSHILRQWFNLVIENKKDLALLLTLEQGKPLSEAEAEIIYGASYIEWFAEEAKRIYGDVIAAPSPDKRMLT